MAMYTGYFIFLILSCLTGSERDASTPEEALVKASETVIFASVEKLGPHRSISTFQRTEFQNDDELSQHEEILQITWKDWDNFRSTLKVDQEIASDVLINNFETWEFSGGQWKRRVDGEPYRVQLRSTWNQWDDVMRHFSEFVEWEKVTVETIESRSTKKYVARFTKPEKTTSSFLPISLEGTVWVDEGTAVRILGELKGVLGRGEYKKEIKLQIQRTEIGGMITVPIPQELIKDEKDQD
jgi:hypothetical protein